MPSTTVAYTYSLNGSDLLIQRPANYYTTSDASFVFEFVPMNVSVNFGVLPVFQPYEEASGASGFIDVSATAYITAPANNFSRLFQFESNDTTFTNYPDQDISYGIDNASTVFNIAFSQALIKNGWANAATQLQNNTTVDQDYIRYTAKAITGGYALTDIFRNEAELIQGVDGMDVSFNKLLNNNISTHYHNFSTTNGMGLFPDSSNNQYVLACKHLLDGLLTNASTPRGTRFLDDLERQSINVSGDANRKYYIWFQEGDVLAIRLAYDPKNGNNTVAGEAGNLLGDNKLYTRTYKMFIQFTGITSGSGPL
jgi:hypothetical protein